MPYSTLIKEYLGQGLAADRPATLNLQPDAIGIYIANDTGVRSFWYDSAWHDVADGNVPEAPEDGKSYARKDAAWVEISSRTRGTATQSGGTLTIDLEGGLVRDFAASVPGANITAVTISNPPASGKQFRFSIYIPNVTTYTFTKPASWTAIGGSDTAFTANKAHLIEAVSYDDGTTILFSMQEIP